jgi:hypothetical protein
VGTIPAPDGVLEVKIRIPAGLPVPVRFYLQAHLSWMGGLTNLCVVDVD